MTATTYLSPVTDVPAIGTINHGPGYLAGATSIVVATAQGTFPSPGANQAFVAILNPNTTGLLDHANTERVIVTVNAAGTWTIPGQLQFNHADGENVALVLSTTWLANLLQLSGSAASIGGLVAADNLSDLPSPAAARINLGISTAPPLAGAVNLIGHSFLAAVNLGQPEPGARWRYAASRIAGVVGAAPDSVISMTKAGGSLFINPDTPGDGCDWGSILQRVLPFSAVGITGQQATGGTEGYTLGGQFNPPLPAVGQPLTVIMNGINDFSLGYIATFTANATTAGVPTMTSTTNLSSSGSYLAGRVGGNGIRVGDYIVNSGGTGIRTYALGGLNFSTRAQVTSVTWNGSNLTTITLSEGAQILNAGGGTYGVVPGNFSQFVAACEQVYALYCTRMAAGAIIRSDDASITYSAGWSTVPQVTGNSGASIRTTATNGATSTIPIPSYHVGGMLAAVGVGTSDLEPSGCTITIAITGGSNPRTVGTFPVGAVGWAGFVAPTVARFATTGADAGGSVVITFNAGSGGTPLYQFDHLSFDAQYQNGVHFITHPLGWGTVLDPTTIGQLNAAQAGIVAQWQTPPGGGFPAIGNITPDGTNVSLADFALTNVKRSFMLGSNITTGTTLGVTLVGQRTITQADQQAPFVGQWHFIPNPHQGDVGEWVTLTAVSATANVTIGGLTYPAWTVNFTRNQFPVVGAKGSGVLAANGTRTRGSASWGSGATTVTDSNFVPTDVGNLITGTGIPDNTTITSIIYNGAGVPTGANISATTTGASSSAVLSGSPLYDGMWLGPDFGHPNDVGATLIASDVLQAYQALPNFTNPDFVAAAAGRPSQGRTVPRARPVDGAYWMPAGTLTTIATSGLSQSTFAVRRFISDWYVVNSIGVDITVTGTTPIYFGIAIDGVNGGQPGPVITDFGLQNCVSTSLGIAGIGTGNPLSQLLPPGMYWFLVGCPIGTAPTIEALGPRFEADTIDTPTMTTTIATGVMSGYVATPNGSSNVITKIDGNGTWTPNLKIPRLWVQGALARWAA